MSVGSDPIECCVRGRFLCVCVTARRRGFRGGLLRRGSEKLLSTCFARLPGIGFAAGGDRRGLPFPAVLRISARAGSSPWAFCVGAPRNFFRPVSRAFPASVSRRGGDRRGLPLPVRCAFRFAARAGSSPPGLLPITDDGRTSFVPHLGRGAGGTVSSLYASAAGVLAGGFLVPAGFGRKCGSHSTGRKRAACCGPFGPGRCLRRDPRPKRTDRLSRYGRDNVGRARGSGCRKTCRGAIRTLPASRCGR